MGAYDEFHPLRDAVGFGAETDRNKLRLVKTEENWQDAVVVFWCGVGVFVFLAVVAAIRIFGK